MKKFIFEDFEKRYEAGVTHFKKSPGKPPVMHFLDEEGNSKKQVTVHIQHATSNLSLVLVIFKVILRFGNVRLESL